MRDNYDSFFIKVALIVLILIIVGYVIAYFYALFNYGNTPVSEMPTWVWWILQNGGKK